jgi:hypothetical protein
MREAASELLGAQTKTWLDENSKQEKDGSFAQDNN